MARRVLKLPAAETSHWQSSGSMANGRNMENPRTKSDRDLFDPLCICHQKRKLRELDIIAIYIDSNAGKVFYKSLNINGKRPMDNSSQN